MHLNQTKILSRSERDAAKSGLRTIHASAIPRILREGGDPEIGSAIIKPVPVNMVDHYTLRRAHDQSVQEHSLLSVREILCHCVRGPLWTKRVPPEFTDHFKIVIINGRKQSLRKRNFVTAVIQLDKFWPGWPANLRNLMHPLKFHSKAMRQISIGFAAIIAREKFIIPGFSVANEAAHSPQKRTPRNARVLAVSVDLHRQFGLREWTPEDHAGAPEKTLTARLSKSRQGIVSRGDTPASRVPARDRPSLADGNKLYGAFTRRHIAPEVAAVTAGYLIPHHLSHRVVSARHAPLCGQGRDKVPAAGTTALGRPRRLADVPCRGRRGTFGVGEITA